MEGHTSPEDKDTRDYYHPDLNYHAVDQNNAVLQSMKMSIEKNTYGPSAKIVFALYCVAKKDSVPPGSKDLQMQNIIHIQSSKEHESKICTNILTLVSSSVREKIRQFIRSIDNCSIHKKNGITTISSNYNSMLDSIEKLQQDDQEFTNYIFMKNQDNNKFERLEVESILNMESRNTDHVTSAITFDFIERFNSVTNLRIGLIDGLHRFFLLSQKSSIESLMKNKNDQEIDGLQFLQHQMVTDIVDVCNEKQNQLDSNLELLKRYSRVILERNTNLIKVSMKDILTEILKDLRSGKDGHGEQGSWKTSHFCDNVKQILDENPKMKKMGLDNKMTDLMRRSYGRVYNCALKILYKYLYPENNNSTVGNSEDLTDVSTVFAKYYMNKKHQFHKDGKIKTMSESHFTKGLISGFEKSNFSDIFHQERLSIKSPLWKGEEGEEKSAAEHFLNVKATYRSLSYKRVGGNSLPEEEQYYFNMYIIAI